MTSEYYTGWLARWSEAMTNTSSADVANYLASLVRKNRFWFHFLLVVNNIVDRFEWMVRFRCTWVTVERILDSGMAPMLKMANIW